MHAEASAVARPLHDAFACVDLISAAAQDNAQLYLSLLPADLCTYLDRLARAPSWPYTGMLKHFIPPRPLHRDLSVSRVLSAEGEGVILCAYGALTCHILRPERASSDPLSQISISGHLAHVDDPEACVPLLVLEHWLTDLRVTVRGLDGQVLREWTGRIQEQADGDGMLPHSHNAMHDARVTERQHIRGSHFVCTDQSANVSLAHLSHSDGWIHEAGRLWHIRHPDVFYTLPPSVALPLHKWSVVRFGGAVRLVLRTEGQLRDLQSGALLFAAPDPTTYYMHVFPHLGVIQAEPGTSDSMVLHSLLDGSVLLPAQPFAVVPYQSPCLRILRLHFEHNRSSVVRYWDPQRPDRISEIDLGDWTIERETNNDLVVASRGGEVLLWHISLAWGVRTKFDLAIFRVCFRNGAAFVLMPDNRLFIVPILHYEGEVAELLAKPLPARVPDTLPLVPARLVFTPDGEQPPWPWDPFQWPEKHMQPPLFVRKREEIYLCT